MSNMSNRTGLIWIGIILASCFLFFPIFMLKSCASALEPVASMQPMAPYESPPKAAKPSYLVSITNVSCNGRRVQVTIKNTGSIAIPFAKAFFDATDKGGKVIYTADSYFHPTTIPAGSTASADSYFDGENYHSCGLTTIQDGNGIPANSSGP